MTLHAKIAFNGEALAVEFDYCVPFDVTDDDDYKIIRIHWLRENDEMIDVTSLLLDSCLDDIIELLCDAEATAAPEADAVDETGTAGTCLEVKAGESIAQYTSVAINETGAAVKLTTASTPPNCQTVPAVLAELFGDISPEQIATARMEIREWLADPGNINSMAETITPIRGDEKRSQ